MALEQELSVLRAENERVSNSIAHLGYEAVFIFGLPAALLAFLYKTYSASLSLPVFGLMCACAFFVSWGVFLYRLRPLRIRAQFLEKRIRDLNSVIASSEEEVK